MVIGLLLLMVLLLLLLFITDKRTLQVIEQPAEQQSLEGRAAREGQGSDEGEVNVRFLSCGFGTLRLLTSVAGRCECGSAGR